MENNPEKLLHGSIGSVKYACTMEWRNGIFITDEPPSSGGRDAGPDPYTLLLSSLASCTLITLRMYIDRKGWNVANIAIDISLCHNKKEDNTITTVINKAIRFSQPITGEQSDRLVHIADACPISKILEGEIKTRTFIQNHPEIEPNWISE